MSVLGTDQCHGLVIVHDDGESECVMGEQCAGPDAVHEAGMTCQLVRTLAGEGYTEPAAQLAHQCPSCAP